MTGNELCGDANGTVYKGQNDVDVVFAAYTVQLGEYSGVAPAHTLHDVAFERQCRVCVEFIACDACLERARRRLRKACVPL